MMSDQLAFFTPGSPGVVNVASVPQRSPFRYPGGKTWLVPSLRRWLLQTRPVEFVEPFTGGGIASLTVAMEGLAAHVTMIELDEDVAAVWATILSDEAHWLAAQIRAFELTAERARRVLEVAPVDLRTRAFQTILKNRVQRGGILAKGAGWIKVGEAGKGITSRWYPETLARRIEDIHRSAGKITFQCADGLAVMRARADSAEHCWFIDPPYTAGKGKRAGSRLYTHSEVDHEEIFRIAKSFRGDFLMTYDNDPDVLSLARSHGFATRLVPMKNTHHAEMTELLIGRDLSWMSAVPAASSESPAYLPEQSSNTGRGHRPRRAPSVTK